MTAYQIAKPWLENEANPPRYQRPIAHYFPTPRERVGATRIRDLSVEDLLDNCGSGSWCDAIFPTLREYVSHPPFSGDWVVGVFDFAKETEALSPPTVGEKLDEIRGSFGLGMTTLANILKASRASVYNWLEDEPRSTDAIQRIEAVYAIAKEWGNKNPFHYVPGKLMKQKLGDDPSMLERLTREELNLDEIRGGMGGLLALMNKQRQRMDHAKMRSSKSVVDSESHKELLERLTCSVTSDKR